MIVRLGCVVEGEGETSAMPTLVRRIAQRWNPAVHVDCRQFQTVSRASVVNPEASDLQDALDTLARRLAKPAGILLLLDADDDSPGCMGPSLLQRAQAARTDYEIGVVIAQREYESWFVAAIESLRGIHGVSTSAQTPAQPESIRGAKEWLGRHMSRGKPYTPTLHQAEFTKRFDFEDAARRSRSFDKCVREVERLLTALTTTAGAP